MLNTWHPETQEPTKQTETHTNTHTERNNRKQQQQLKLKHQKTNDTSLILNGGTFSYEFFFFTFCVCVCVVYLYIMALYSQWAIHNIYDALKSVSLSQCERLFAVAVVYPPKDIDRFRSLRSVVFFWFSIINNFLFESIHTIAASTTASHRAIAHGQQFCQQIK